MLNSFCHEIQEAAAAQPQETFFFWANIKKKVSLKSVDVKKNIKQEKKYFPLNLLKKQKKERKQKNGQRGTRPIHMTMK